MSPHTFIPQDLHVGFDRCLRVKTHTSCASFTVLDTARQVPPSTSQHLHQLPPHQSLPATHHVPPGRQELVDAESVLRVGERGDPVAPDPVRVDAICGGVGEGGEEGGGEDDRRVRRIVQEFLAEEESGRWVEGDSPSPQDSD